MNVFFFKKDISNECKACENWDSSNRSMPIICKEVQIVQKLYQTKQKGAQITWTNIFLSFFH